MKTLIVLYALLETRRTKCHSFDSHVIIKTSTRAPLSMTMVNSLSDNILEAVTKSLSKNVLSVLNISTTVMDS